MARASTRAGAAAVAIAVLALGGCKGTGGGGGDGGADIHAFNFNAANMALAAGSAARAVDAFAPLSDLLDAALAALWPAGAPRSGEARALAACAVGSASLAWTDLSGDGTWSGGDGAVLTLAGCRVHAGDGEALSGTVRVAFSRVERGPPRSAAAELDLDLAAAGAATGTLRGRAAVTAISPDGVVHGLVFQPAGASVLVATGDGAFELACFDVRNDYRPAPGIARRIAAFGVLRVLDRILGFDYGAKLLYGADDRPGEGALGLLSFMPEPDCPALGVAGGVGDSDRSRLVVVPAGAAGEVRLELFAGSGQLVTAATLGWWDLLHPAATGVLHGANALDVARLAVASLELPRTVGALALDLAVGALRGAAVPLCTAGRHDVSPPPTLAVGETVTIAFADCATDRFGDPLTLGGHVTLTVSAASGDPASDVHSLAVDVVSDVTAAGGGGTTGIAGTFRLSRTAAGGDVAEHCSAAGGAALTIHEGGATRRLGAFSVRSAATGAGGFTVASAGDGLSIASELVAGELAVGVTRAIEGAGDGPPQLGEARITAGDGTSLALGVAAGGAVALALDQDGDGAVDATLPTTWVALHD